MKKFETDKKYFVQKENYYTLVFKCFARESDKVKMMLVDVEIKANVTFLKCPVLFTILQDYYTNFLKDDGFMKVYVTIPRIEGEEREVVFSHYDNYLWIDSSNEYNG